MDPACEDTTLYSQSHNNLFYLRKTVFPGADTSFSGNDEHRFDSTWTVWPLTGWLQPDNVAEFVRRNMALDNDTNSTEEWQKACQGQRQPCCGNLGLGWTCLVFVLLMLLLLCKCETAK